MPTWRCFHCDQVFRNRKHAAEHFGDSESETPACKLSLAEGHLVTLIRKLQAELREFHEERDQALLALMAIESGLRDSIRSAEERGYNRGVTDTLRLPPEEYHTLRSELH